MAEVDRIAASNMRLGSSTDPSVLYVLKAEDGTEQEVTFRRRLDGSIVIEIVEPKTTKFALQGEDWARLCAVLNVRIDATQAKVKP